MTWGAKNIYIFNIVFPIWSLSIIDKSIKGLTYKLKWYSRQKKVLSLKKISAWSDCDKIKILLIYAWNLISKIIISLSLNK